MVISFPVGSPADIPLGIVVVGVAITLASGTITGMRVHRWLFYRTTWGERLPADTGAWLGLLIALAVLVFNNVERGRDCNPVSRSNQPNLSGGQDGCESFMFDPRLWQGDLHEEERMVRPPL